MGCHAGVILKNNMPGEDRDKDRWLGAVRGDLRPVEPESTLSRNDQEPVSGVDTGLRLQPQTSDQDRD